MLGIILLAHGNRDSCSCEVVEQIAQMVRAKISYPLEVAFLEFSNKDLKTATQTLVKIGVEDIKIIPYFLLSGGKHLNIHLPKTLEVISEEFHCNFTIGNPLGLDKRLAEIIIDRINESL